MSALEGPLVNSQSNPSILSEEINKDAKDIPNDSKSWFMGA